MWKRKKKDDLELKGEEREVSLTTPIGGYKRKRIFGKKEVQLESRTEASMKAKKQPPRVFEDTITVEAEHYEEISLGKLERGASVIEIGGKHG